MRLYETWAPYVPVAERRRRAEELRSARSKEGRPLSPVRVSGRAIAQSFWGSAWCQNLESYSDFENRLPRGRSYLRNGSVIDLQISAGSISALVQGTDLYNVRIEVKPVAPARWQELCRRCVGGLGSLVELLSGRISREVMTVVTERSRGLFPAPAEIEMSCSCPDWATMCKHVAATLYGTGARFDASPELLFTLRGVDPTELIVQVGTELPASAATTAKVLSAEASDLGALFGIDLEDAGPMRQDRADPSAAAALKPSAESAAAKGRRKPTQREQAREEHPRRSRPAPLSAPAEAPRAERTTPPANKKPRPAPQSAVEIEEQASALKALLRRLKRS